MASEEEKVRQRLEGLLHFLDVTAPDMHNRYIDLVNEARTLDALLRVEAVMLAELKPA